MQTTIAITSKWQIHIPKAMRKELGLKKPGVAHIQAQGRTIVIIPQKSKILQMAGKYAKYAQGKRIDVDNIRDYIDYTQA